MNVREWYEATSTKHGLGLTDTQKAALKEERQRVLKKAGTTIGTIRIAICKQTKGKGRVGDNLLYRLATATKDEKHQILVRDERPEP